MAEALVIVESPAKAKTINKFLGKGYKVLSSKGHVRDLPRNWRPKNFEDASHPPYVLLEDREKLISEILEEAEKSDRIIIATDPDREGEAIGWHLAEVLKERGTPKPILRVMFNEITKHAVVAAMADATARGQQIDQRRVDAQQARRVIDRLMGYNLSPLLWGKVMRGLSGGRVQSVALRVVCEREEAIEAFVAEEYWNVSAQLAAKDPPGFTAKLKRRGREELLPHSEAEVRVIEKALEGATWRVANLEVKERKKRPPAPYITSKFQQDASRTGMPVRRAMQVAQKLYEGMAIGERGQVGLITYMRTDSTRVSDTAITDVRAYISSVLGAEFVPEKPNVYTSKKEAQDAHEAIRPTYMDLPPERVAQYLTRDELRIYRMIWNRFVASQMKPAIFEDTIATISAGDYGFEARGSVERFAGFLRALQFTKAALEETPAPAESEGETPEPGAEADAEGGLPRLAIGDVLKLVQLDTEQKFTQPPPRFTEATLVKELEENGIGRPSTYAAILDTLGAREYTHMKAGRFHPSRLGRMVNKLLVGSFEDLIQVGYTARLEKELDEIEESRIDWLDALREFNAKFMDDLGRAEVNMPDVRGGISQVPAIFCEKCGSEMKLRFGRFGDFLACSSYPECKNTRDLIPEGLAEVVVPCPVCAKIMAPRTGQFGAYLQCKDYPTCPGRARLKQLPDGAWVPVIDKRLDENCPQCGSVLLEREGRNGTFVSCSAYPKCEYIKQEKLGLACPRNDGGDLVVKRSRRGKPFYGCSRWPACEFVAFDLPIPTPCPACAAPFVLQKETKKFGTYRYCHREECPWTDAPAGAPPIRKPSASAPRRVPARKPGMRSTGRAAKTTRTTKVRAAKAPSIKAPAVKAPAAKAPAARRKAAKVVAGPKA